MFDNDDTPEEFGPAQRLAYALAGTVALPSPFPASGRLSLGVTSRKDAPLLQGRSQFYLKLVHVLSGQQSTTRFLALDDLRAVSLPGEDEDSPRVQKPRADIQDQIEEAQRRLSDAGGAGVRETPLFPDAIIYVGESAPIFMRVVYEFGVTAAESSSRVSLFTIQGSPC